MRFDAFFCRASRSEPQICRAARERIAASAGLTMRQRSSAFWIEPERHFKTTARIAPAR
jgi:hypothetical protein